MSAVCVGGAIVGCGGESSSHRNPSAESASAAGTSSNAGSTGAGGATSDGGASQGSAAAPGSSTSGAGTPGGGGDIALPQADPEKQPQCFQKAEAGGCADSQTRYYYDAAKKQCQAFEYSGCDGNDNNFPTRAVCMDFCLGFRGCFCDEAQDGCKVAGACTECPVDLTNASDKPCTTVGLTCTGGGSCRCQQDSEEAEPAWLCSFRP